MALVALDYGTALLAFLQACVGDHRAYSSDPQSFGDVSVILRDRYPELVVDLAYFAERPALFGKGLVLFDGAP